MPITGRLADIVYLFRGPLVTLLSLRWETLTHRVKDKTPTKETGREPTLMIDFLNWYCNSLHYY